MRRRPPLPRLWMMTDERQSGALRRALETLPKGSGVVFRHYTLAPRDRRRLFDAVRRICRRRGLLLLLAGDIRLARAWRADGRYGPAADPHVVPMPHGVAAHDLREIKAAERSGADFIFLSAVFATRSHPGGRTLGRTGFVNLARQSRLPVIALGGMTRGRARSLAAYAYGWAAIDAWTA